MNKNIRTLLFRWIYTLSTIGILVFIFTNSLQSGENSSLRSIVITRWINEFLGNTGIHYRLTEHIVRKLAHFTEFMILGLFLTLTLRVYTPYIFRHLSWPLFAGLLTAVIDETLQMFGRGRGPSLRDVWIDFSGFIIGLCIALFLMRVIRRKKKRTKSKR